MKKYNSREWTDELLLELIRKNNDRAAFSELYTRYWDKIFMLAANALESPEVAEECVQDIFFSLWNRRSTLHLKYSVYTYLAVAVKYRVINILDKAHRERKRMAAINQGDIFDTLTPSAEVLLLEKELFARLESSVALLPEKCQLVFRMSREEGKNRKQIAAILNISEKTVDNHLNKALKDIGKNLSGTPVIFILSALLEHRG